MKPNGFFSALYQKLKENFAAADEASAHSDAPPDINVISFDENMLVHHAEVDDPDFESIPLSDLENGAVQGGFSSENDRRITRGKSLENYCFECNTLHDTSSLNSVVQISGQDAGGKEIVVIYASGIPPCSYMRSEAVKNIKTKLQPIAEAGGYNLVFVMSPNLDKEDKSRMLPAWWCLKVYRKLPLAYRKNIQQLVFIHPTFYTELICNVLRPFVSKKAHHKIHNVKQLADLEKTCNSNINLDALNLGDHVYKYDRKVLGERPKNTDTKFY